MSVRSAQAITVEFVTSNPTTQAATNADSLPTGTLVVNGTDNGATVTVTNVDTGRYKAAVTLPTLAIGDTVEIVIAATVSTIAGKAVVWRDTKDVLLDGSGDVTFNNTSLATVTTVTNQLALSAIVNGMLDEVNTAARHNVNNSVGKQIRTGAGVAAGGTGVIYTGTCPSQAGMSSVQIKLDSGASSVNDVYQYDIISIISGTDAGDSAIITGYVGSTRVATVNFAWAIQPDNTSVFEITPTAAVQVIGNVTVGTNLDKTSYNLAADQAVNATKWAGVSVTGMPMPTYTQPTGFLAATFPATVASTTNITAGTITTTTNLTNAPTSGDFTAAMKASITAAVPTVAQIDTQLTGTHGSGAWTGGAGGTVDANVISVNGTTFAGANVPAILADGVQHGGTPGSSTATLALRSETINNPSGVAVAWGGGGSNAGWTVQGGGSGGANAVEWSAESDGGFGFRVSGFGAAGVYVGSTGAGNAIEFQPGSTGRGVYISRGVLMEGLFGDTDCNMIDLNPVGGHGISILAPAGKKAMLLAGDAATDALAIAAGAGSPVDIFNADGSVNVAAVSLAANQHVIVDSGTVTDLTNLPAITTDWLTADGIKADAVNKIQAGLSTYAGGAVASVTAPVSVDLSQTLSAARALDAIADTDLTLNDSFHCAIAAAVGKETIVDTTYTIETPSTGTVLRTFTLDSATTPTSRT